MKYVNVPEDKWLCSLCGETFGFDIEFRIVGRKERKSCIPCLERAVIKVAQKGREMFGLAEGETL